MTKHYPLPLVGEQYYQTAVARCRVGEIVDVCIERGNPVDPLAIVARRREGGETIGYVATDSFVRRVLHDDEQGVAAAIGNIYVGTRGFLEVSLLVSVIDEPADIVRYRRDEASDYRAPELVAGPGAGESTADIRMSPLQVVLGVVLIVLLVRCAM